MSSEIKKFQVLRDNINQFNIEKKLTDESVGGLVFFQGKVRNHNEGFEVESLEYDAYVPMAEKEGKKIIEEALKLFEIEEAFAVHRIGHLEIGDTAIWIGVGSHHRKAAFLACEYIIDRIKTEVPIWKKEHYKNQESKWVACHECQEAMHRHDHKHHRH